jgi:hypothetical protein
MLPKFVKVRDHAIMEHGYALLFVNTRMCMLIRYATQALLNAVEFVHLSKSCMQNTHIALCLVQFACWIVDVVE